MHMDGSGYEYLLCCLFPPRLIFIAIPFILADINCYPSLRHISLFPTLLYSIFFIALAVSPLEPVRCIASLKIRRGVSQRRADSFQRCKKEIDGEAMIKQGKEATRKAEQAPGIRQPSSCRVARSRPLHTAQAASRRPRITLHWSSLPPTPLHLASPPLWSEALHIDTGAAHARGLAK